MIVKLIKLILIGVSMLALGGCWGDDDTPANPFIPVSPSSSSTGSGTSSSGKADTTAPVVTLNGGSPISIIQNTTYTEFGATAKDDVDGNLAVSVSGGIRLNTVGSYTMTYTATDAAGNTGTATRIINVVAAQDTNPPVVTLNGAASLTLVQNAIYTELNATAVDDTDGAVSVSINGTVNTAVIGSYTLTYTAVDSAGNQGTATRIVRVVAPSSPGSNNKPVISLLGNASEIIGLYELYSDAGVTANDVEDGNITADVVTVNPVDTSTPGMYTLTYNVKDSNGVAADEVTRTVTVSLEKGIVDRHNYYRALDFSDSDLSWDVDLANHAQAWADYLAANFTNADNGSSPHASVFQAALHTEDDYAEGENIAWSSAGRGYLTTSPVDISDVNVANGYIAGSVDAWASEKAYYDYVSNDKKPGFTDKAIGHYTQVVWQKTKKVGCGLANSTTDHGGEWVVCRYEVPGNLGNHKPYCANYTVSDLYTDDNLVFTEDAIRDETWGITKVLEDREVCTRTDTADSTLSFTGIGSASLPNYNAFNTNDGSNLWNMNFDDIRIDSGGQLILTNAVNDRYMRLKLIGVTANEYIAEAYWWVSGEQYNRTAILKLKP